MKTPGIDLAKNVFRVRWTPSSRQQSGDRKVKILSRFAYHCADSVAHAPAFFRRAELANRSASSKTWRGVR
jgi:hypothetical protein